MVSLRRLSSRARSDGIVHNTICTLREAVKLVVSQLNSGMILSRLKGECLFCVQLSRQQCESDLMCWVYM